MLIYLLYLALSLLALVLLVVIGGRFLPETYHVDESVTINAPRDQVWQTVLDVEQNPFSANSNHKVLDVLRTGDTPTTWTEDLGQSQLSFESSNAHAPERITFAARDSVVPMSMQVELSLSESDGKTTLRAILDGRIASGTWHVPIFRVIVQVFGMGRAGVKAYLKQVARNTPA